MTEQYGLAEETHRARWNVFFWCAKLWMNYETESLKKDYANWAYILNSSIWVNKITIIIGQSDSKYRFHCFSWIELDILANVRIVIPLAFRKTTSAIWMFSISQNLFKNSTIHLIYHSILLTVFYVLGTYKSI